MKPGITFTIPIKTQGGDNDRTSNHWSRRHKQSDVQRDAVQKVCAAYRPAEQCSLRQLLRKMVAQGPLDVRVVRISPANVPPDPQNLGSKLKSVIDGLADVFGVNDGDPHIKYTCAPERGPWGVRVEVGAREEELPWPTWDAATWKMIAKRMRDAGQMEMDRWLLTIAEDSEKMAQALEARRR